MSPHACFRDPLTVIPGLFAVTRCDRQSPRVHRLRLPRPCQICWRSCVVLVFGGRKSEFWHGWSLCSNVRPYHRSNPGLSLKPSHI